MHDDETHESRDARAEQSVPGSCPKPPAHPHLRPLWSILPKSTEETEAADTQEPIHNRVVPVPYWSPSIVSYVISDAIDADVLVMLTSRACGWWLEQVVGACGTGAVCGSVCAKINSVVQITNGVRHVVYRCLRAQPVVRVHYTSPPS